MLPKELNCPLCDEELELEEEERTASEILCDACGGKFNQNLRPVHTVAAKVNKSVIESGPGKAVVIADDKELHGFLSRHAMPRRPTSGNPILTLFNWVFAIGLVAGVAAGAAVTQLGSNFGIGVIIGLMVAFPLVFWLLLGARGILISIPVGVAYVVISLLALGNALGLVVAVLVYAAGWISGNRTFNQYKETAKQRVQEIEQKGSPSTSEILELGILLKLVLGESTKAADLLKPAISREDGNALLWNLSGVVFGSLKAYPEALRAFDKAIGASPDAKLLKQIERNRKLAERLSRG